MGFLLASFMGGLCLGSSALPRLKLAADASAAHLRRARSRHRPGGFWSSACCRLFDRIYIAGAEYGLPGLLTARIHAAVCLLPPTILMGASLPAIVRWIESTPRGVSWWGLLYGGNTLGAVFGCLLAGFYLLRIYDTAVATYWRRGHQLRCGGGQFLGPGAPAHGAAESGAGAELHAAARPPRAGLPPIGRFMSPSAISGASALGAEIVWTRLMGMLLGLHGLCVLHHPLGVPDRTRARAAASARSSRAAPARALALGWCQVLLAWRPRGRAYMIAGLAALLADRSVPRAPARGRLPARYGAHAVGHPAARHPVGRQFPVGAGRRRRARRRSRAHRRAMSTPPTRLAPSSERWRQPCSWCRGSARRTASAADCFCRPPARCSCWGRISRREIASRNRR